MVLLLCGAVAGVFVMIIIIVIIIISVVVFVYWGRVVGCAVGMGFSSLAI